MAAGWAKENCDASNEDHVATSLASARVSRSRGINARVSRSRGIALFCARHRLSWLAARRDPESLWVRVLLRLFCTAGATD